jgi:uncharacterized protein YjbJ (UPF0337 family)
MDENRIEGTARKYGGRVQEGVGSVTGDTKTRVEGAMNEAAGAAQQLYGTPYSPVYLFHIRGSS